MDRSTLSIGTAGTVYPPLERVVKNAKRAEEKGYASIWWPDHLMGWQPEALWNSSITPLASSISSPHTYLDAIAAIAVVASHTERVILGTAVTEAIRRHPAMLAQEFLTLDHFSKGRVVIGIGAGEAENTVPYGLPLEKPASRLEEAIEVIKTLWSSSEPVDYYGHYFRLQGAVLGLEPYGENPPPIWVAAHGPRMLDICGRLGDGWIPTALGPQEFSDKLALIRGFAEKAGRHPDEIEAAMFCYCAPAPDHSTAHKILNNPLVKCFCVALSHERFEAAGYEHPMGSTAYGLLDFVPAGMSCSQAEALAERIPFEVVHDFVWHGTAEDIFTRALEFSALGLEHLILWNVSPFDSADRRHQSFRILDEVLEAFSHMAAEDK